MDPLATPTEEAAPAKNPLAEFLKKLEEQPSPEEKLHLAIGYMREALAQPGNPNFKGFWEVRRLCLPLFKDVVTSPIRTKLWEDYIELTREGRRLKNLLDQETAFAVEQIDAAIASLEKEMQTFIEAVEEILGRTPSIEFPLEPKAIERHSAFYKGLQRRLSLLNIFADRILSLRKELIKTEMRIRQKNQFFERLSKLGDAVFPKRKELIREVSEAFIADVHAFVRAHFSEESFSADKIRRSVFFFREEIKGLQSVAKALTLNSTAFSASREELSRCWDMLKGMEKELKKEFSEQKQKSGENATLVREKLAAVASELPSLSIEEGSQKIDEIARWMREVELTHSDVKALKEELHNARLPLEERREQEANAKKAKDLEHEKRRQESLEQFRAKVEALKANLAAPEADALLAECRKELASLPMNKVQRQAVERELKGLRDTIEEIREKAMLQLSDDDKAQLSNLIEILEQRKARRKEIKEHVEELRKLIGGSSLDFEKAIEMNELMAQERERLEKIEEGIAEIEGKIRILKRK